jgi:hypothetical protein
MQEDQGAGGRRAIGRDPPTVELENAGLGRIEPDLVILQADRERSGCDGARRLEDQLPLALPEKQAEGGVNANCRQQQGRRHTTEDPARVGQRLLWRQRALPAGWRRVLLGQESFAAGAALGHEISRRQVRRRIRLGFHKRGTKPPSNRHTPGDQEQPARKKGTRDLQLEVLEVLLEVECRPLIPSLKHFPFWCIRP